MGKKKAEKKGKAARAVDSALVHSHEPHAHAHGHGHTLEEVHSHAHAEAHSHSHTHADGHAHAHSHVHDDDPGALALAHEHAPSAPRLERGAGVGKTLFFDAFSGIAGDMTIAALVDLGAPLSVVEDAVASLGLGGFHLKLGHRHRSARRWPA